MERKGGRVQAGAGPPGLTDLQLELIAGVASVQLRAGQPEAPHRQLRGPPVVVPDLPDHLLVGGHGVHACGRRRHGGGGALSVLQMLGEPQEARRRADILEFHTGGHLSTTARSCANGWSWKQSGISAA